MCAKEQPTAAADDDVWGEGDSDTPEQAALDREWETRHQQFYNSGYRDGLDEGKELTLQHGFNAGFAEGAHAGFEFGLVRGALQTLVALHNCSPEDKAQVLALLQQLTAVPSKSLMRDACTALLAQPVADGVAAQLSAALQQLDLEDDEPRPDASAAVEDLAALAAAEAAAAAAGAGDAGIATATATAAAAAAGSSGSAQEGLPLPQQLVAHTKQELVKLGFDVGTAPPFEQAEEAAAAAAGSNSSGSDQRPVLNAPHPIVWT